MLEITPDTNEAKCLVLQSLEDLFGGTVNQLTINQSDVSFLDITLFYLGLLSPYNDYTIDQIGYLDLYFENANGAEDVLLEKLHAGKVMIVDGSEHLERFPRLREALRAKEAMARKTIHLKRTKS